MRMYDSDVIHRSSPILKIVFLQETPVSCKCHNRSVKFAAPKGLGLMLFAGMAYQLVGWSYVAADASVLKAVRKTGIQVANAMKYFTIFKPCSRWHGLCELGAVTVWLGQE